MLKQDITIGFELIDDDGRKYSAHSSFPVYDASILNELGEQFNTFLKQAGFVRTNDYLLMMDVTEEERARLEHFLMVLRGTQGGGYTYE